MTHGKSRFALITACAGLLSASALHATNGTVSYPASVCRAVDSRDPDGPNGGNRLVSGTVYAVAIANSRCPTLPVGVNGYRANVTITASLGAGFLSNWRAGDPIPVPLTSNKNYSPGLTIANEFAIPVNSASVTNFMLGVSDAHLIVDVLGYEASDLPAEHFLGLTGNRSNGPVFGAYNQGTNPISAGIRGTSNGGIGVESFSMWNFGGYFRGDNATAAFFDGVGTYGGYGQSREGNMRSGIAGALNDPGGMPLTRGFLGMDQGASNWAVFAEGNYGGTGAKYFVEPHPHRADLVIRYVALEGREAGTYFRGRGKLQNGLATIDVPEDFRLVTDPDSLTVQITPIGEMATVAVVRMALDRIVVRGSRNVAFSYMVNGVRKSHRDIVPMGPGSEYAPQSLDAKIPLHLTPVQKEFLISNGTYNADGTVNLETARALGWDKSWKKEGIPMPPKAPDENDEP